MVQIQYFNRNNKNAVASRNDGRDYDIEFTPFEGQVLVSVYAVGKRRKVDVTDRKIGQEITERALDIWKDTTINAFFTNYNTGEMVIDHNNQ